MLKPYNLRYNIKWLKAIMDYGLETALTGAGIGGTLQHPQGERDQPRERGSGEAGRGHDTVLPGHADCR